MTPEESFEAFRRELFALEQRLSPRLARLEQEIYGDDKNEPGIKARLAIIGESLISQRWHGYALIASLLLELLMLFLIFLLFVRVY